MLTHGNIAEYRGTMSMEVTVKSGNFLVCLHLGQKEKWKNNEC